MDSKNVSLLITGEDINLLSEDLMIQIRKDWRDAFFNKRRLKMCSKMFEPIFGKNWTAAIYRHRHHFTDVGEVIFDMYYSFICDSYHPMSVVHPEEAKSRCLAYLDKWNRQ